MQLLHAGIVKVISVGDQVIVSVDREKLRSDGKSAVEGLLLQMHVYVCTADLAGVSLYDRLSEVGEDLRRIQPLVAKEGTKQKQILQHATFCEDGVVRLREYEASPAG